MNQTAELIETELPAELSTQETFSDLRTAIETVKGFLSITVEKHGIGKVTASRRSVKSLRISIDKRREFLVAAPLKLQRDINAFAKSLTEEVSVVEKYLSEQESLHEKAKERDRQDKLAAIAAKLATRLQLLHEGGCSPGQAATIQDMTDDDFAKYLAGEIEIARLARDAAEAARLQAEENKRQADELRIRAEELDAEKATLDKLAAQIAAEQKLIADAKAEEVAAAECQEPTYEPEREQKSIPPLLGVYSEAEYDQWRHGEAQAEQPANREQELRSSPEQMTTEQLRRRIRNLETAMLDIKRHYGHVSVNAGTSTLGMFVDMILYERAVRDGV